MGMTDKLRSCAEFDDETWNQTFLESQTDQNEQRLDEESDNEDVDLLPPPLNTNIQRSNRILAGC